MLLNKRTKRSKPGLKFNPRLALIGQEDLKRVRKVPQTWYSGFQNACFIRFATGANVKREHLVLLLGCILQGLDRFDTFIIQPYFTAI